ncbi:MAG: adenosylcobinamide-GDP ribazoletransferase [Pseudomonadota bacterium]|nr:adenosylcobinamide-GDP ribazoletransferase [Pseudomonadota bacterium]
MNDLRLALGFLTRLPVRATDHGSAAMGRSLAWYPLAGALIGALLAAAAGLLALGLPAAPGVGAALVVTLWVWLSGGLHLDGLADTADAAAAGGDRSRHLAIMKDPRSGPAGVVAVVVVLLTKYAALASLLEAGSAASALLIAPIIGRALVVAAFLTTPYVRAGGLGDALAHQHSRSTCQAALGLTLLAILALGSTSGALSLLLTGIGFGMWRRWSRRLLGGFTGDLAGALVEIGEVLSLIGCVALLDAAVR